MEKHTGFDKLIASFAQLEDPRGGFSISYSLNEILFLTVSSVLSGFSEWEEIVDFGTEKIDWLRNYLPYKNGIPSHDTLNRVMGMINYRSFEEVFVHWTTMDLKLPQGVVINIDGKKLRSSASKMEQQTSHEAGGKSAVHVVEAWCGAFQMCLAQYKTADKSNEIMAIPAILDWIEIKGSTITIDAMGCQKTIAAKIINKEADYILAVKGNQKSLQEAVVEGFKELQNKGNEIVLDYYEQEEVGHGRIEYRKSRVLPSSMLPKNMVEEWEGLRSIVEINSKRIIVSTNQTETETRYYISSLLDSPEIFNKKIREHWQIENQLHWTMDVIFDEDASRKRSRNSAQNFAIIRRMVLNILKNNAEKISINRKMNKCAMSDTYRDKNLQAIFGRKDKDSESIKLKS
jgi:predicted transposase YbfD/YdcC